VLTAPIPFPVYSLGRTSSLEGISILMNKTVGKAGVDF
jgi:hypothetical protein